MQAQITKEWLVIHCSLSLLFYATQDHCPRSSTTYSQLGPPTSNINQENVLQPHLQPSLMGHLSVEVPSFQMTQLVSSTVMCFQVILLSWCHSWGKENTGKEEEIYSRRAETLLLLDLPLRWLSDAEDVPDYQDTTGLQVLQNSILTDGILVEWDMDGWMDR